VTCPIGYHKVPEARFAESCNEVGAPCPDGLSCFCKPCTEAFDVYQYELETDDGVYSMQNCTEDELCATVQQTKRITFHAVDIAKNELTEVRAVIQIEQTAYELTVEKVGDASYEFSFSYHGLAMGELRVYVDEKMIPGMPVKVQVVPRDCKAEFGSRTPSEDGVCVCGDQNLEIGHHCVDSVAFFLIIASFVVAGALIGGAYYLRHKRILGDQMWLINLEELRKYGFRNSTLFILSFLNGR